jgi:hypothetical protein
MQLLINLAFGAALAGLALGPTGWADIQAAEAQVSHVVLTMAGVESASPLDAAAARARAAMPELPTGSH